MSEQANLYKILQYVRQATDSDFNELSRKGDATLAVRYGKCIVDDKWIAAIEHGMDFIGKAIDEERRFIRSEGEVQPIEKVRRVSKESVQHLARHSELITRDIGQEEDVVPDKLYTVERLNDYATYENRFLYRLLTTVKNFITARYAPIVKAVGDYSGKLNAHLKLDLGKRKLDFSVNLLDERQGDEYLLSGCNAVERLNKLIRTTDFYLSTPLMVELSNEDSVQTAITKNNVLKMDKNFKEAVALYDYLLAYEGDGYSVEQCSRTLTETEDIEALCRLLAFSDYARALELSAELERECDEERREQLEQLKKRSAQGDNDDYLLVLQQRSELLDATQQQVEQLKRALNAQKEKTEQVDGQLQVVSLEMQSTLQKTAETVIEYTEQLAQGEALLNSTIANYEMEQNRLKQENLLLKAQLSALLGRTDKVVASEQDFDELEAQYEALGKLVNREWTNTKDMLRKQARKDLKKQLFGKKSKDDGDTV